MFLCWQSPIARLLMHLSFSVLCCIGQILQSGSLPSRGSTTSQLPCLSFVKGGCSSQWMFQRKSHGKVIYHSCGSKPLRCEVAHAGTLALFPALISFPTFFVLTHFSRSYHCNLVNTCGHGEGQCLTLPCSNLGGLHGNTWSFISCQWPCPEPLIMLIFTLCVSGVYA